MGDWVVQLRGDWNLVRTQISLKSMMKMFEEED